MSSNSRKTKSKKTATLPPPLPLPLPLPQMTEPPIIVTGPNFTIYGEIHNMIDNQYYQQLYQTRLNNNIQTTRILVEKTTHEPFLRTDYMALELISKDAKTPLEKKQLQKQFVNGAVKGSEWIYLTRTIDELPVERIDIRVESGFPGAAEEHACYEMQDPVSFIQYIEQLLDVATKLKEQHKYDKPGINEMYETLMKVIPLQLNLFIDNLTKVKPPTIDEENLHNICTNLKYLSALLFDSNLLNIILENNQQTHPKQLVIFVGARHALNMYELFLKPNGVSEIDIKKTPIGNEIEFMKPQIADLLGEPRFPYDPSF